MAEKKKSKKTAARKRAVKTSPGADTYSELARSLGVVKEIIHYHKTNPNAPQPRPDGLHDVAAWREYLLTHGRVIPKDDDGSKPLNISSLKARLIKKQIEKLDFSIRRDKAEFVPLSVVKEWGDELGHAVRKVVCELHQLAPTLAGLSVAETAERLKAKEQDILRQLYGLARHQEQWEAEALKIMENHT